MKTVVVIYLLLVHIFVGIAIVKTDIIARFQVKLGYEVTSDELTPHYREMLAFQKRIDKNIPGKSLIFIGDSLTQGLAVIAVSPQSINYGIGQDTTVGVLKRIPFYRSILKSKAVIIAIGINDLKRRSNDEIVKNYLDIVGLIPKNIPVLLSAVLAVDEVASGRAGFNERIKKLNGSLEDICKNSHRLHFLNISKLVVNSDGNLSTDYHLGDGVHLNGLGNKIWIAELKKYIKIMAKKE
ncbi:MAG: GDSL-type esterase/lipase family protein [Gammaproteobacteria bacterium]|nr:GDSL-type esterase/lipase family protein [Gammaproteobacteria bacterium]